MKKIIASREMMKWRQKAKNRGLTRTTDNHLGGDDKRLALNLADLHKSAQPSSRAAETCLSRHLAAGASPHHRQV